MRKILWLLVITIVIVTGCYPVEEQIPEETDETYKTLLSKEGTLSIVRQPEYLDISQYMPQLLSDYPERSSEGFEIDVRSTDLKQVDVTNRLEDLLFSTFDDQTQWPGHLPAGFDIEKIMAYGKDPGLNVRQLHKENITGKGVGVAIIDQGLLVDHIEYKDRLKLYEEIHCGDTNATMHGAAVASIAVGKSVGVAPEANLYYIAETHGVFEENEFQWDLIWIAKSIDRVVEINELLNGDEKIKVISISLGIHPSMPAYEEVAAAIDRAKDAGIYTVYVGSQDFLGMGRHPLDEPNEIDNYVKGEFWKSHHTSINSKLMIPMDSRVTASPTGSDEYVFYRTGGMSWSVPYVAGLYALGCQVRPNLTPEAFFDVAMDTADEVVFETSQTYMVNPVKLIMALKDDKYSYLE